MSPYQKQRIETALMFAGEASNLLKEMKVVQAYDFTIRARDILNELLKVEKESNGVKEL